MLLAVLGVLRVLGVLAGIRGILLSGILLGLGVFALIHVRHLLFWRRYSVSMAGNQKSMHDAKKVVDRRGKVR